MSNPFEQLFSGKSEEQQLAERLEKLLQAEDRNDREIDSILNQLRVKYPNTYKAFVVEDARVQTGRLNGEIIEIKGRDGSVKQVLVKRDTPVYIPRNPQERERNPNGRGKNPVPVADVSGKPKDSIPLPPQLLNDQGLREQLQKLGILQGNNVVFEDPNWKKEFESYVNLLGFLKKIEYKNSKAFKNPSDRAEVVKNYVKISNDSASSFILDKRYLQIQYATAIYNDIIGNDCILEKTKNNTFVIKSIDASGNEVTNPIQEYKTLLNGPNQNKLLDVAILVGIMENNSSFDKNIVGQKALIQKILEQNKIKGPDGGILKPELLKLEWTKTRSQIIDARKAAISKPNSKNYQNYQELTYILNFIDNEEYLKKDYNEDVLSQANIFRLQFRGEKASLDAMQRSGFDIEKPETLGNLFKNISANNAGVLILAGLFFTLFGGDKWKHLGLGVLAGLTGAYVAGDALNQISNFSNQGRISGEKLDMLDFGKLQPVLNLDSKYQPLFSSMLLENNSRMGKPESRKPFVQNPFILGKIYYELISKDLDGSLSTDQANVDKVFASLQNDTINGTEFKNHEAGLNGVKVTKDDVKAFLEIASEKKETGDVSLRDAIEPGKDPLSSIENKDIFGVVEFNNALSQKLSNGFGTLDRTKKRQRIELQKMVSDTLQGNAKMDISVIDKLITDLGTKGYDAGYIDIVKSYKSHVEWSKKLTQFVIPSQVENTEVKLVAQQQQLTTLQQNFNAEKVNLTNFVGVNGALYVSVLNAYQAKSDDFTRQLSAINNALQTIQSNEIQLDSKAVFGGDKGNSIPASITTLDEATIKGIYTGSDSLKIQDTREKFRELILFLNGQYGKLKGETTISGMTTVLNDASFQKALSVYKTFNTALASETSKGDSGRDFILDRSKNDYPKFTREIFKLFESKVLAINTTLQNASNDINSINTTNVTVLGNELQKVDMIKQHLSQQNEIDSATITSIKNITGQDLPTALNGINKTSLSQAADQKYNTLLGLVDTTITSAKTKPAGQEFDGINTLIGLITVVNLPQAKRSDAEAGISALLDGVKRLNDLDKVYDTLGNLIALKGRNEIPENMKNGIISSTISDLRDKYLNGKKISDFAELSLNGTIITAFTTSLLSQAGQIVAGQPNPAQDALTKITGNPAPTLKEFNDIVVRFSLTSGEYTNFLHLKKLVD